jgi:hypothetical protein
MSRRRKPLRPAASTTTAIPVSHSSDAAGELGPGQLRDVRERRGVEHRLWELEDRAEKAEQHGERGEPHAAAQNRGAGPNSAAAGATTTHTAGSCASVPASTPPSTPARPERHP